MCASVHLRRSAYRNIDHERVQMDIYPVRWYSPVKNVCMDQSYIQSLAPYIVKRHMHSFSRHKLTLHAPRILPKMRSNQNSCAHVIGSVMLSVHLCTCNTGPCIGPQVHHMQKFRIRQFTLACSQLTIYCEFN
jgi:hypothetical protein